MIIFSNAEERMHKKTKKGTNLKQQVIALLAKTIGKMNRALIFLLSLP